ncbi:MAG: radical SAM family heme chaperone HemW [Candidatus Eisenbacteria bacterium]|nr:radical SAM family heme chaperone HemW [Candidatus Eisenbacteria bacterium]
MRGLPSDSSLGLYLHIPFCRKKCSYCSFMSVVPQDDLLRRFAACLKREIDLNRDLLSQRKIATVYVGGGTPGVLGERLLDIIRCLSGNFDLSDIVEFTVELNPESSPVELLRGIRKLGVNRVSIGVQSFQDSLLSTLGRIHTPDMARTAYSRAREAGFQNVSIDLMAGIPGQNPELLKEDLEQAVSLLPEHISYYLLTPESMTPLSHAITSGYAHLPADSLARRMLLHVSKFLKQNDYERYETSNFARPAFESRHNINYWKRGEYLGLGPSACSHLSGKRWRNNPDLEKYLSSLEDSRVPMVDEEVLTSREILTESFMLGLRMKEGIPLESLRETIPPEKNESLMLLVSSLSEQGLLSQKGGNLSITEEGLPVSDSIIVELVSSL